MHSLVKAVGAHHGSLLEWYLVIQSCTAPLATEIWPAWIIFWGEDKSPVWADVGWWNILAKGHYPGISLLASGYPCLQ